VARCLSKDPDGRFPDADSLVRALRAVNEEHTSGVSAMRTPLMARLRQRAVLVVGSVAVVALALLGYSTLRDRVATPGHRAIAARAGSVAPVRIAVLPFGVLGDERFAYLGDGMVELFSTQLDGAGPLRSVDPRALLAFVGRGGGEAGARPPADGQAVARRFDAALFLAGSVVEAGGQLRIRAALYDVDGRLQAEATSELGDEGELFKLVDQVTRELIGSRYVGRRERLTRLAAATTSSVSALKAYLMGEGALREGHFDEALASFQRAVAQDTAFALAWYRLAVAAEWTVRPAIAGAAAERAIELAGSLPEHDRMLVSAWNAYASGDAARAERIYRQLLDGYPDDVEAWLQLGEVLFHYGPLEGRPLSGARAPFARALSLEPAHEGALLHLARIAAADGERAELGALVDRLIAAHPQSEIAVEARALRAFATGDSVAIRRVIAEYRGLDSDAVFTAIWTVGYTRDPQALARLARLLIDDERPSDVRAAGRLLLATAELARGRPRSAKRELAAAAGLNAAWALELGCVWAASGIIPDLALWRPDSLRVALDGWDAAAVPSSLAPGAFLEAHDDVHPLLRRYLIGLLDASRGGLDAADSAAAELERMGGPSSPETLAANLARGLRAEILSRAGRDAEALAVLESAGTHSPYALAVASPFHAGSRERFLHAHLLARLGRPEEALSFYMSLGDGSVYDLPYVAPAHLRAAALLEASGRTGEAAEHYRRVAELWRDADPELRATVEEARRKARARPGRM
jgi:tetratricopeptide (TPR) repeat protein